MAPSFPSIPLEKKISLAAIAYGIFSQGRSESRGEKYFDEGNYHEAEKQFEDALHNTIASTAAGVDENDNIIATVRTRALLGKTRCKLKKFEDAVDVLEPPFSVIPPKDDPRRDKEGLFNCAYWLGVAFCGLHEYSKAEEILRRSVEEFESIFRRDESTIEAKYQLCLALYEQDKHPEAEGLLREALAWNMGTLSYSTERQFRNMTLLAKSLFYQEKYHDSEGYFRQLVIAQERTLGRRHRRTIATQEWLDRTIDEQHMHTRSRSPRRTSTNANSGSFDTKYRNSSEQLRSSHYPSKVAENKVDTTQGTLSQQMDKFFTRNQEEQKQYTHLEIDEISTLLRHSVPQWSKSPRTYVILRTIGHLGVMDKLLKAGFSDYWFPVNEEILPETLDPSIQAKFFASQHLVLTKSMNIEKGKNGTHCYFDKDDEAPYERKEVLGRGGFGQVDRVLSKISYREYARKLVHRNTAFKGRQREGMKRFVDEIKVLKRLEHLHIVTLIGSYSDKKYIAVLMTPIAQMDLESYLQNATQCHHPQLRTFFGCLANALAYMHRENVRHKDIKPANVLVDNGNVLFTDFGLALDYKDRDGSTTSGMVGFATPRYSSPEAADHEPRKTKSDIWSLGLIFMVLMLALKQRKLQDMDEYLEVHGEYGSTHVYKSINALPGFIKELEDVGKQSDNQVFGWIREMLLPDPRSRPSAASLWQSITAIGDDGEGPKFCGICCAPDTEYSDYTD